MITEDGAFGHPGYMVIVRYWPDEKAKEKQSKLSVESFVVVKGSDEEQLKAIEEMKSQWVVNPLFASFTILRFVSETRPLEEPQPLIHIPTQRDTRRFGRSKYDPK